MTYRHPQSIALGRVHRIAGRAEPAPRRMGNRPMRPSARSKSNMDKSTSSPPRGKGPIVCKGRRTRPSSNSPSRHCQQPLRHPRDGGPTNDRRGPSLFQRRAPTSRLLNLWGIIAYCRHCIGARGGATPCLTRDAVGLSPPDRNWDSALSAGSQDEAFMRSIRRRSQ